MLNRAWIFMPIVLAAWGVLLPGEGLCSRDSTYVFEVEQSSGYRFTAHTVGFGCVPVYETVDGYEVVQRRDEGDWYYAVRNKGYRMASPYAVGEYDASALGLQMHGQSTAEEMGIASSGTDAVSIGTRRVLIVFGKLKGDPDPYNPETDYRNYAGQPESIDHFLLPNHDGSLGHFIKLMSRNQLILTSRIEGDIDIPVWYESDSSVPSDYSSNPWLGARQFASEVFRNLDANPPPCFSFADYDGDGDGYVDLVVFIYDRTRLGGFVDGTIGFSGYMTGDGVEIGDYTIFKSTVGFELAVGGTAHELGHILDLPELYDATTRPPEEDSAGLGLWALMARGAAGWADAEWWPGRKWNNGPSPFCVWSRIRVGWLSPVSVTATALDMTLRPLHSGGDACKIVPDPTNHPDEYFLICNRQSGMYYTRDDPSSGLLIYHVDDARFAYPQSNNKEKHKTVDLECPDGLFSDEGYPGTDPDPAYGGDNLDFWAHDSAYWQNYNGNKGDSRDVFDGLIYTSFTPYTNPSSNGYNGHVQDRMTHFAVADIDRGDGGDMVADMILNYWAGPIATDTVWEHDAYGNPIYLGGDITVLDGGTLTIADETTVLCNGHSLTAEGDAVIDDRGAVFVGACGPAATVLYGDVSDNGEATPYDASLILRHIVSLVTLAGRDSVAADVSGTEGISSYDASLVLRHAVGKIIRFPADI